MTTCLILCWSPFLPPKQAMHLTSHVMLEKAIHQISPPLLRRPVLMLHMHSVCAFCSGQGSAWMSHVDVPCLLTPLSQNHQLFHFTPHMHQWALSGRDPVPGSFTARVVSTDHCRPGAPLKNCSLGDACSFFVLPTSTLTTKCSFAAWYIPPTDSCRDNEIMTVIHGTCQWSQCDWSVYFYHIMQP